MGGLGQVDRTQLLKALTGKVVGLQTYIDELEEGVRGSASPKDLETLLQLVHLSFTAPRRDEQAYAAFMAEVREQTVRRTADPNVVFWDRWQTVYYSNHPRRRPPDLKQLEEVSLDRALQAYKQRFADASDFTFVFVGKTEPEQLQPLVERYLGSLPARKGGKGERWKDVGARPPSGVKRFEVRSGVDQKSTVSLEFTGRARFTHPDERLAWSVAEAFALRLRDVLREDLGATYNVSVTGDLFRRPYERREAQIVFTCAPENVPRLLDAVYRRSAPPRRTALLPNTRTRSRPPSCAAWRRACAPTITGRTSWRTTTATAATRVRSCRRRS